MRSASPTQHASLNKSGSQRNAGWQSPIDDTGIQSSEKLQGLLNLSESCRSNFWHEVRNPDFHQRSVLLELHPYIRLTNFTLDIPLPKRHRACAIYSRQKLWSLSTVDQLFNPEERRCALLGGASPGRSQWGTNITVLRWPIVHNLSFYRFFFRMFSRATSFRSLCTVVYNKSAGKESAGVSNHFMCWYDRCDSDRHEMCVEFVL